MPLTDAKIRNAKAAQKPQKLADSNGLYLEIRPTGSKFWRYRYRIDGKENVYALGEFGVSPPGEMPDEARERHAAGRFTLAEARNERERCRGLVKQGIHPSHNRQMRKAEQAAANGNTFEVIAREWVEKNKSRWTPYYLRQIERFMAADVYPHIGKYPIRSVTAAHVLQVLTKVEDRGAVTVAINLRQWCSAVFRYAVATLRADADPAAALKGAVTHRKTQHRKPLPREGLPAFKKALDAYGGRRATVIALKLVMLTFVRTVELRGAKWTEFDIDRAEWRIPAERMKMGEPHIVPLSRQSVELLEELRKLTGHQDWLFPNQRRPRDCMTATTLNRALERMGFNGKGSIGFSTHGFRATASTILNEAGFRADVIERQLAHKERNKVRASYNQAEYLEERRTMMQQWADMIDRMSRENNNVTPIREDTA